MPARITMFACAMVSCLTVAATADVLYTQPPAATGALQPSSYWDPDGSDYDQYVWDGFMLSAAANITELRWRGGGSSPVNQFEISIYTSIPAGSQPNIVGAPLRHYMTPSNAGETSAGVSVGGVAMKDYHFTLPTPLLVAANTRYWVQIEAWQPGIPNWALAPGTGGNGSHFHRTAGVGDAYYFMGSGDTAFSIVGTPAVCPSPVITLNPVPVSVCFMGPNVSFSIAATTTTGTLTYQWRKNGFPINDGPNGGGTGGGATISGSLTPTLTIAQPSYYAQPGIYDCLVSNPCGNTASAGAQLNVGFAAPTITANPAPATVCTGGTAAFSVAPSSASLSYTWRKNGGAGLVDGATTSGSIISGANTATLSIAGVQPGDVATYSCTLSSGCTANSTGALLSVITCCPADLGMQGGLPGADGLLDNNDFIAFIDAFFSGNAVADLGAQGGAAGSDGSFDNNDFVVFIDLFFTGC